MDILLQFIDIILHIDRYLGGIIQDFGVWSYIILFVVIFCETGLVVTPLLPGDSLLFAAGALAAIGALDPLLLILTISSAALLGDTANYWLGYFVGPKIFHKEKVRFLNKEYLNRTHQFYEKHGGKTVIIARFIPIIRTFAPFVAGIGRMPYWRFITFSFIAAVSWPVIFVTAGFYFGNLPVVKKYFSLAIVGIILVSVIPIMVEMVRMRLAAKKPR